jgi:small acid-soluble spore protein (thioredoxin-like protein)
MGKHNSDSKRETINKMKNDIENTEFNYRQTEKLMNNVDDEALKTELQIKNMRREQSLRNMKNDIQNEYDKENNFKNNIR